MQETTKNTWREIFKGKVIIVGMGNTLRRDDGFGPALMERLDGKVNAICIDAGTAPENFAGRIARENPDTVLIVDALHLGLAPGKYKILRRRDILKSGLSTHDVSPHMFIEYLEKETAAQVFMLGVQPKDVSFGQGMSDEVKKAVEEIADLIKRCMRHISSSR